MNELLSYDCDSVYREFRPKVYRYLLNLVGPDDVEDVVQAVFEKIARSLPGFRNESSVSTWVYRIASNTATDHFRARHSAASNAAPLDEEFLPEGTEEADDTYIVEEMRGCIRGLVSELPESCRSVLLLIEFEEMTAREVAEILGTTVDAVKIRLHRARRRLRELMENRCSLYHDGRNILMCDRK